MGREKGRGWRERNREGEMDREKKQSEKEGER